MQNDASYKRLYAHAELVADLLRSCIREAWVAQLDFATLERVNGSHVDQKLQQRHSDVIWRCRWRHTPRWVYVCLLLEFQSQPDHWMPLRMLNYVALFYDHLLRTKALKTREPLPLVLPIVLYNGEPRWRQPLSLKALRGELPVEIERHQPELLSALIDQGKFLAELPQPEAATLSTLLFRMDQAETESALAEATRAMATLLQQAAYQHLAASIGIWLKRVLLPPMATDVEWTAIEDFRELTDMLQERVRRWPERWKREGRVEGLAEGRQKGRLEVLLHLTQKRYGASVAAQIGANLEAIDDPQRLEELTEAFLDCTSAEQWLERVDRALN
jgi:predicted transposase YdaD